MLDFLISTFDFFKRNLFLAPDLLESFFVPLNLRASVLEVDIFCR